MKQWIFDHSLGFKKMILLQQKKLKNQKKRAVIHVIIHSQDNKKRRSRFVGFQLLILVHHRIIKPNVI